MSSTLEENTGQAGKSNSGNSFSVHNHKQNSEKSEKDAVQSTSLRKQISAQDQSLRSPSSYRGNTSKINLHVNRKDITDPELKHNAQPNIPRRSCAASEQLRAHFANRQQRDYNSGKKDTNIMPKQTSRQVVDSGGKEYAMNICDNIKNSQQSNIDKGNKTRRGSSLINKNDDCFNKKSSKQVEQYRNSERVSTRMTSDRNTQTSLLNATAATWNNNVPPVSITYQSANRSQKHLTAGMSAQDLGGNNNESPTEEVPELVPTPIHLQACHILIEKYIHWLAEEVLKQKSRNNNGSLGNATTTPQYQHQNVSKTAASRTMYNKTTDAGGAKNANLQSCSRQPNNTIANLSRHQAQAATDQVQYILYPQHSEKQRANRTECRSPCAIPQQNLQSSSQHSICSSDNDLCLQNRCISPGAGNNAMSPFGTFAPVQSCACGRNYQCPCLCAPQILLVMQPCYISASALGHMQGCACNMIQQTPSCSRPGTDGASTLDRRRSSAEQQ